MGQKKGCEKLAWVDYVYLSCLFNWKKKRKMYENLWSHGIRWQIKRSGHNPLYDHNFIFCCGQSQSEHVISRPIHKYKSHFSQELIFQSKMGVINEHKQTTKYMPLNATE